eukprot:8250970-Pyramimonas_sp.AAC.1
MEENWRRRRSERKEEKTGFTYSAENCSIERHDRLQETKICVLETNFQISDNLRKTDPGHQSIVSGRIDQLAPSRAPISLSRRRALRGVEGEEEEEKEQEKENERNDQGNMCWFEL